MIVGNYLIIVAANREAIEERSNEFVRFLPGMHAIMARPLCRVLVDDRLASLALAGDKGVLLGNAYGPDQADRRCEHREKKHYAFPDWRAIMRDNWGDFLVVDHDPEHSSVAIARSPFGQLPCYYISHDGLVLLSSSVRTIQKLGLCMDIDQQALLGHLFNVNARRRSTCIAGVRELEGGHCLTVHADQNSVECFWSPWRFAQKSAQLRTIEDGPARLQELIIDASRKLSHGKRHVLLGLSGGLDSSIVAAGLAAAGAEFSCFTLVTEDGSGDERLYACAVADHLGVKLHEVHEDIADVDIGHCAAAHLPRPLSRVFAQSGDLAHRRLGAEARSDAYASGGGGDNIFCYVHSARPLADRLLSGNVGRGWLRTARDIALLTDSNIWTVFSKGIKRACFQTRDFSWPVNRSFLAAFDASQPGSLDHPWMRVPPGELPGKAQHIAWILGVLNHIEGYERELALPTIWPLLAQPIVEFCLTIPSWAWLSGGQNRVIARQAFASLLPAMVIGRRSKGSPDSFVIALFEHRKMEIRERLCEGWLARQGILDVDAIAARCGQPAVHKDTSCWDVLRLLDAENWVRTWVPS